MLTGWALVELARARRSKSLPREFCLAVTEDKVIALAMSAWSEGGGGDGSSDVVVKVKREQAGSWSRGGVRIEPDGRKLKSGQRGGTIDLAGGEQFPVNWDTDSNRGSGRAAGSLASSAAASGREQRDLEVEEGRLELEQLAALAKAAHDEIIRSGHHRVEDLVGHAVPAWSSRMRSA